MGTRTLASTGLPGMHRMGADTQDGLIITYGLELPGCLTAGLTAPTFLQ